MYLFKLSMITHIFNINIRNNIKLVIFRSYHMTTLFAHVQHPTHIFLFIYFLNFVN